MAITDEGDCVNFDTYCQHNNIIRHSMGFVCQECGLVIPRISYNTYMIDVNEYRKIEKSKNPRNYKHDIHIHHLMKICNRFNAGDNKDENRIRALLRSVISHFDLVFKLTEISMITKIILKYQNWHRTNFPNVRATFVYNYSVCACLLAINRQRNIMLSRESIIEHCRLNPRIFNKTYILVCQFLGYRNDFETQFKNFVLNIIYTMDLPFSCYSDSLFVFKKYAQFFTSKPKNVAIFCIIISYYSLDPKLIKKKIKLLRLLNQFHFQFFPLRNKTVNIFRYYHIPMTKTKDVYDLWKYRSKLFC